ncbi:hypothetical protein [Streptomyces sp. NPDC056361]|uniref:hypothetical protein n=1 Tax=Streptomyces sp. NPDC056361 TaxID=3345795 RepID=UPI0035DBE87E
MSGSGIRSHDPRTGYELGTDLIGYRVEAAEEKVYVGRTKDRIKDAPEFDEAKCADEPSCLEQFARSYGRPHR